MPMRFLADESCDFAVVRSLRKAGHDVLAVAEISPRADDDVVLNLAAKEQCILLTEDKDFGELVYAKLQANCGVLLIRYPAKKRATMPKAVLALISKRGEELENRYVVMQPGRVRVGRKPKGKGS